jgi:uncharacterized protein (TIGR02246 family)
MNDEQQIRDVMRRWLEISGTDDLAPLGELMADDIVFLQPGQPPLRGREAALKFFQQGAGKVHIHGQQDIQDMEIAGDLAYVWANLNITMTVFASGETRHIARTTLSIFRRERGRWVLYRDANLPSTMSLSG